MWKSPLDNFVNSNIGDFICKCDCLLRKKMNTLLVYKQSFISNQAIIIHISHSSYWSSLYIYIYAEVYYAKSEHWMVEHCGVCIGPTSGLSYSNQAVIF